MFYLQNNYFVDFFKNAPVYKNFSDMWKKIIKKAEVLAKFYDLIRENDERKKVSFNGEVDTCNLFLFNFRAKTNRQVHTLRHVQGQVKNQEHIYIQNFWTKLY